MGRIQRFFYAEENQGKIDVAKGVLGWIVVTIASYLYWALLLLMASLFLLNVWHVTWTQINHYSLILMCITSVVYLIWSYRKKKLLDKNWYVLFARKGSAFCPFLDICT